MTALGEPRASEPGERRPRAIEVSPDPWHYGVHPWEPWPEDVPLGQDDTHWRYEGDPRGARRAELRIAACWSLAVLAAIGLAWVYVAGGQPQVEGALLLFAFLGLGVGFVLWARDLMPGKHVIASRGHHSSPEADRISTAESLARGIEPMARRPFLFKMLGAVGTIFGIAFLFPIASLGKRPGNSLYHTAWRHGSYLTTEDGVRLRPSDVAVNGIVTVFPDGDTSAPQSPAVLINLGNAPFKITKANRGWNVGGLVCFSKICTHAGCPVGLYNVISHQLVCPCHQSTFDVLQDCKPVFGPAPRPLPQLPITVDSAGYLIAQSDFTQPVGPGFWSRG